MFIRPLSKMHTHAYTLTHYNTHKQPITMEAKEFCCSVRLHWAKRTSFCTRMKRCFVRLLVCAHSVLLLIYWL